MYLTGVVKLFVRSIKFEQTQVPLVVFLAKIQRESQSAEGLPKSGRFDLPLVAGATEVCKSQSLSGKMQSLRRFFENLQNGGLKSNADSAIPPNSSRCALQCIHAKKSTAQVLALRPVDSWLVNVNAGADLEQPQRSGQLTSTWKASVRSWKEVVKNPSHFRYGSKVQYSLLKYHSVGTWHGRIKVYSAGLTSRRL
jgi:hypothetical protein